MDKTEEQKSAFTVTLQKSAFLFSNSPELMQSDIIFCNFYERDSFGCTFYEDVEKTKFIAFVNHANVLAIVKNN